ncbi:glycoside hydrolase family 97 protein [Pedobacter deserti]|uniref:glycoside hydrolase family 97 protein n=1 Tax=Pedobacter deserti TaxID=2817382 RepID=UPI0021099924|nr:glycoside hydrolase family 97 protein [Pedobacter sp. SYSU D00382]
MNKLITLSSCVALLICLLSAQNIDAADGRYALSSPDKRMSISLAAGDSLRYSVRYNEKEILHPSAISMRLGDRTLGPAANILRTSAVRAKDYNELVISFKEDFDLVLRAYNEGVAYRFVTRISDSVTVVAEQADFRLEGDPAVIWQETDNYTTWEGSYIRHDAFSKVVDLKRATTPALFSDTLQRIRIILAESDVFDYPGMYLQKQGEMLRGEWAGYPAKTVMGSWGNFVSVVKERAGFLARTSGSRSFPWRVVMATDDDRSLLTNRLIAKLARPNVLKDISWIKPGKATWEWWHDALLPGAPVASGMGNRNTALYNYYVDFATAGKLEYLMIDAGWSDNYDVTKVNPKLDVKAVISRARDKQVGVFLWCVASSILKDLDKSLDFIASTGAVGIKVDFFDRDDQLAIRLMETIAMECAKRKLMVNFHGCPKPTGLEITYPNVVNYEAVRGAESHKWDYSITPDHHLIIPFIRMLAGPMDYTPGAMRNKTKADFKPIDPGLPSGQGTRCHELAMFVVYRQPFGMLADSPTAYMQYPDIMQYLSQVPAVCDETRVLSAELAEYAVVAKRKGRDWYLGAMTNWTGRTLEVDFGFLPAGRTYEVVLYTDGQNAEVDAELYDCKTLRVTSKTKISLKLAPGGGAAAVIKSIF